MKKLISLIAILMVFCTAVFADVGPTDILGGKTLNIILDLTGLERLAVAHAGVTYQRPALDLISEDYDNTVGTSLVIRPEEVGNLSTKKTIYIWYYLCALEGQCEVIFMPSAFWSNGNEYMGYTLTSVEEPSMGSNYLGTLPIFNNHVIGANPNYNASQTGKIINYNDAGVSKGFITYELDVDFTEADPVEYSAPWTIQIRAI